MKTNETTEAKLAPIDRRSFLKGTGAGVTGLSLGLSLGVASSGTVYAQTQVGTNPLQVWLNIRPDNTIELAVAKTEMGQGIGTALSMIMSDELDADWSLITIHYQPEIAPFVHADPSVPQFTFGSTSVSAWYSFCRQLGAAAKLMLKRACAARWHLNESELITYKSKIYHLPTLRVATYGELAEAASQQPVPDEPALKKPFLFHYIGRSLPSKNIEDKVEGRLTYSVDFRLPEMRYAAVKTSPVFGGEVTNFDALQATMPPGQTLVAVPQGVVVIAPTWWQANTTLENLAIEFASTPANETLDSEQIFSEMATALAEDGTVIFDKGDAQAVYETADIQIEAQYEVPYLAHAPLEPLSCTASVSAASCELWLSHQAPGQAVFLIAQALNIPPSGVKITMLPSGGSFGRRVETDFVIQAALASKAISKPVNMMWSRPQDMQQDRYRPAFVADMKAGFNSGELVAWLGKNCGQNIFTSRGIPIPIDPFAREGFVDLMYKIPNQRMSNRQYVANVPVGFWRSVGQSHNNFFVESFIDEAAHAAGYDPYFFRRRLLRGKYRERRVLSRVAKNARWWHGRGEGKALGLAMMEGFGSILAMVAEVSVIAGSVKVYQLWCAVDCGTLIHPDDAKAQVEGAIVFGLSACLFGEITLANGRVEQSTYEDYPVVTMKTMPKIHIEFMRSHNDPGGLGETATPSVAPAVANAIFAATGQRVRKLPFSRYVF